MEDASLDQDDAHGPTTPTLTREVVRDLLGITRGFYRTERAAERPDLARLEKLEDVGKHYRLALKMAAKYAADTMGGLGWAEKATSTLTNMVADSSAVETTARLVPSG